MGTLPRNVDQRMRKQAGRGQAQGLSQAESHRGEPSVILQGPLVRWRSLLVSQQTDP